jgi:hypothetical protein
MSAQPISADRSSVVVIDSLSRCPAPSFHAATPHVHLPDVAGRAPVGGKDRRNISRLRGGPVR